MSRAINVDASLKSVTELCAKHNAIISAIEELPSGGTRVVLSNSPDAATMVTAFGSKVIKGLVDRKDQLRAGRLAR
jgi:hypothetical protein